MCSLEPQRSNRLRFIDVETQRSGCTETSYRAFALKQTAKTPHDGVIIFLGDENFARSRMLRMGIQNVQSCHAQNFNLTGLIGATETFCILGTADFMSGTGATLIGFAIFSGENPPPLRPLDNLGLRRNDVPVGHRLDGDCVPFGMRLTDCAVHC
jgi:hypothetical protein